MTRVCMLRMSDVTVEGRVDREARTLAEAGYQVTVVGLRGPGQPECEQREHYDVLRPVTFGAKSWRQPYAKLREFSGRTRALTDAVIAHRADIVHCDDTVTLEPGLRAARTLGASVVYDVFDLWPDSLEQHAYQGSWPVQTYWRRLERRLVPQADEIIVVSTGFQRVLQQRFGVESTVVPNVPDLVAVGDRDVLRRRLRIGPDRTIVLCQGVLIVGRKLIELLDAVALVPGVDFVVQGYGPLESDMRTHAFGLGISDRVHFMGQIPQQDIHGLTCGADIGTIFIDGVTLNHQMTWPNRVFGYAMAGIPTVATDVPGMREIIEAEDMGVLAPSNDAQGFAHVIGELAADPLRRKMLGAAGRKAAETTYNWEIAGRELLTVYDRLAEERR